MTAPAKFAFNDINELAKTPVLRNCGGLSRFREGARRGASANGEPRRFTATSSASTTNPKRARAAQT